MAVWLVRAGEDSRYEERFFRDHRVYLTCDGLAGEDFTEISDYAGIRKVLLGRFEGRGDSEIGGLADLVFEFVMSMTPRDFVITPRRSSNTLAIGQIISPYGFDPASESPFCHLHDVNWLALDVPAAAFNAEFLSCLSVSAPLAQVKVSNATAQVQKVVAPQPQIRLEPQVMASTTLREKSPAPAGTPATVAEASIPSVRDVAAKSVLPTTSAASEKPVSQAGNCVLEGLGFEAIGYVIAEDIEKHGLTDLIRATLKAGGLTILPLDDDGDESLFMVASGSFGLERPNTCVRVHPADAICDTLAFGQFCGAIQGHQSEQGLLVSWSGFDPQVLLDVKALGPRVRLWTRKDIVGHLLDHYLSIDGRIQQRIPLKRIWIPANLL